MITVARDVEAVAPMIDPVAAAPTARVASFEIAIDLAAVAAEWRDFERTAAGHVFQSCDFVSTWLATVGAARSVAPQIVLGRARDGTLVAILPFGMTRCMGARLLAWLGGEHADYHCGLYAPGFLEGLATDGDDAGPAFVRSVVALFRGRIDIAHFQRQPTMIGGAPNPFATYRAVPYSAKSHLTRLGDSWETYYRSKRNSSSRRHDRLKWQKLEASAPVEIVDARTPEEIEPILAAMFAQKKVSLSARGVPDMFACAGVPEFYREIARRPWPEGMSHVAAIRAGGDIVAANWGLVRGDRYYYVMTSYCPGRFAVYSPGRALMYHLMAWATERGITIFDFTIGDEDYKGQWCEEMMTMHDSVVVLTARGLPLGATFRALKQAKRVVKSSPRLNRAVGQVRRRLAVGV
ncbi:MAG: GNAT family N-acetyltransferase [Bauldia sp.]|nr:GNAT family N-acetyltransferase [Bauldia sp.]